MRKRIFGCMIMIISCIMFFLCGTVTYADSVLEEMLIGKWVNSKIILNEEVTEVSKSLDSQDTYWEFREDGRVRYSINGEETMGTWYISDDAIVAEFEDGPKVLAMEEGVLKETIKDGFYFYFVKKEVPVKRDMKLVENYNATSLYDEISDVLNNGEVIASGGMTLSGDCRYFLCHQNQSGFDSTVDYYGIYDYGTKTWPIEMQEMSFLTSRASQYLEYIGDGVFLYNYYSGKKYYLSAPLGDYFSIDFDTYSYSKYFQGGYSLGELENGKLGVLSVYGKVIQTGISGGRLVYQCDKGFVIKRSDWDGNTEEVILYYYDTNQAISINETYATRMTDDTFYKMTDTNLYVQNLLGMDGQNYYAVFDKDGNVTVPAMTMEEFDYNKYREETGNVLYDSDICKITLVDEALADLSDQGIGLNYIMKLYIENKMDRDVVFVFDDSYLNDAYLYINTDGEMKVTDGEIELLEGEARYVPLVWGPAAGINNLNIEKVFSVFLHCTVIDMDSNEYIQDMTFEAL